MNIKPDDRHLLLCIAGIIAAGLLVVLLAGQCSRPAHAAIGPAITIKE